ncbi:MAG: UDP-N-acetylmuramoyl-L-alanine--D-glutamate ligase [Candidatus Levyibacteriota bacterium]|jgi:UDP-N-acetylmuramoylalanine--D-glutamate ligase
MIDFKNKKIAVVGEGIEGVSSAKFLKAKGAEVTILDKKQGEDYLEGLDKYDLVVRSPGVRISTLEKFVSREKITSQTKIFFDLCPCEIIGVTGTKGKGTTASLIHEMLIKQGFNAYLGGNIGLPPFEFLDKLNVQSKVVLELSSFQLMDLKKSPHIAVMLMITSEHLDWHSSIDEYIDAKRNLVRGQNEKDFVILNRDYPATNESDIQTKGKAFHISREREAMDEGCFVRDGKVWLRVDGRETQIIDTNEILLPGKHNFENVCAATMAAHLAGVSKENIAWVIKTFKGLEHRLELVATINGVRYYDDSFSTTPETAIAAIQAFTELEILILGGSSKNSDFSELGSVIAKASNVKAIIGIGVEWERIKSQITNPKSQIPTIEGAKDMKTIVAAVAKIAQPGDVILLTPACASFDMFKNYKDRGEQFKEEVLKLR